ncbi:hypothetical protein ACTXG7_21545 [Mycolicibacterium sp. Dal123E01]|uniref:hypothetical protein n=1 Tax=Mycolicibacterium sp. Dal123E01 TaxID=3457578 RepID=UPI00403E9B3A
MIECGTARGTQPRWSLADLREQASTLPAPLSIWATPSVAERVERELPGVPLVVGGEPSLPAGSGSLLVIGGGSLIDRAKLWRYEERPDIYLIACASIWGSGAEVSPIAVGSDGERKRIVMGDGVAPDVRVVWPELAQTVSTAAAHAACGDVWAHAIEGLLSPLASDELVQAGGDLVRRMLDVPLGADARYFELGAEACSLQAQSSVGLVHGIAHVLEGPLAASHPELGSGGGHAALCATFLYPVLRLLAELSHTFEQRLEQAGVAPDRVLAVAQALHDPELYTVALPLLESRFRDVLRDPCSRTSCTLIRPGHLEFFSTRRFM